MKVSQILAPYRNHAHVEIKQISYGFLFGVEILNEEEATHALLVKEFSLFRKLMLAPTKLSNI
jgi:hypothetical protein